MFTDPRFPGGPRPAEADPKLVDLLALTAGDRLAETKALAQLARARIAYGLGQYERAAELYRASAHPEARLEERFARFQANAPEDFDPKLVAPGEPEAFILLATQRYFQLRYAPALEAVEGLKALGTLAPRVTRRLERNRAFARQIEREIALASSEQLDGLGQQQLLPVLTKLAQTQAQLLATLERNLDRTQELAAMKSHGAILEFESSKALADQASQPDRRASLLLRAATILSGLTQQITAPEMRAELVFQTGTLLAEAAEVTPSAEGAVANRAKAMGLLESVIAEHPDLARRSEATELLKELRSL
jgi:hypothetical protein